MSQKIEKILVDFNEVKKNGFKIPAPTKLYVDSITQYHFTNIPLDELAFFMWFIEITKINETINE